ncbi:holo-[acyl-carrier protein] synthase [Metabacillus crassostreae]|uniref:holo-ACP synthase n=1 Tax=Metabacillus crassostreae TaxID=929098 RepID=UPI00195AB3D0|nr:holo-ACP synthase [Metabacillus crassostreae]MBM7606691.1 holo-[acyl-carrier protein] synthase [Metabacillus crassostreae]
MIMGIGLDIIELDRIRRIVDRQPGFIKRILTLNEIEKFASLSKERKVEFLAGRFAVKEAYSKALGTGIGEEVSFQDVEVMNDDKGKPVIKILTEKEVDFSIHVSITHTRQCAAAQVILEK